MSSPGRISQRSWSHTPTGTVRGAIWMAFAGNLDQALSVEEEVNQVLAVAAGHDHRFRPQLQNSTGELLLAHVLSRPS